MCADAVVVLTKDRTETLARVLGAVRSHHPSMPVIVMDGSAKSAAARNAALVGDLAGGSAIYHVTGDTVESVRSGTGEDGRICLDSLTGATGVRDISGQRNLALVASDALGFSTTFCMDDDMQTCLPGAGCCLPGTVAARYARRRDLVVGGRIAGIVDDSYVGRLCRLCEAGRSAVLDDGWRAAPRGPEPGGPLWIDPGPARPRGRRVLHSSGGMMAIKIPRGRLLPFPPGYNEDWNWCLLQSAVRGTEMVLDGCPSYHLPPAPRSAGADGIVWESLGDAMFYSLRCAVKKKHRLTMGQLRGFVLAHISSGPIRGEITRTKNMLDRFIAEDGAAKLVRHRDRLADAADALAGHDMREFAGAWFDAQKARTRSLSYILQNRRIKENIRCALKNVA